MSSVSDIEDEGIMRELLLDFYVPIIDCYVPDRLDYVLCLGQFLFGRSALVMISFAKVMIEDFSDT